jgi:hypothetical protein
MVTDSFGMMPHRDGENQKMKMGRPQRRKRKRTLICVWVLALVV